MAKKNRKPPQMPRPKTDQEHEAVEAERVAGAMQNAYIPDYAPDSLNPVTRAYVILDDSYLLSDLSPDGTVAGNAYQLQNGFVLMRGNLKRLPSETRKALVAALRAAAEAALTQAGWQERAVITREGNPVTRWFPPQTLQVTV